MAEYNRECPYRAIIAYNLNLIGASAGTILIVWSAVVGIINISGNGRFYRSPVIVTEVKSLDADVGITAVRKLGNAAGFNRTAIRSL